MKPQCKQQVQETVFTNAEKKNKHASSLTNQLQITKGLEDISSVQQKEAKTNKTS